MPPETISGEQLNQTKKIQRLATLDFARGLSIFLMVILHVITDCLNSKELIDNMSDIPLLNALLFVILPFLGGLAGFFYDNFFLFYSSIYFTQKRHSKKI